MTTRIRAYGNTAIGVLIIAVMLFPLYWMVNVSLQPTGGAVATPWFPLELSFHGYASALRDQGDNLVTSLVVALGTVAFSLLVATPAAYALAQFRVRGAGVLLFAILISQMIPGIVVANALYSAYSDLGLLNSIPGLILADATHAIPFAILIMRAYLLSIPAEVIEAARVDGAGQIRAFCSIVVPMSRNALVTAALFTFLFTWSDFLFALTLTTTEDVRPVTLGLYQYIGAYGVPDWSPVMATAVLASIPAVVLLVVAQRFVAAGVASGAVK
ncbi:MAG TPA: carbohydrate ABC transporter permease [Pseudonocardia sp.]|jgi:multiple sugar transport system permease protein|uniref:carbohydrate ABC transporter permease n=1 Tax=Pseudonocardia sp. TaxID=60912 RepID=UPI002B4B0719|nr:carbohydrate ABC transporter permease [Pseudonocardia sp.]HLU54331.1 carbohydrate ABC transporter permease [Pseudonocardia sp.]